MHEARQLLSPAVCAETLQNREDLYWTLERDCHKKRRGHQSLPGFTLSGNAPNAELMEAVMTRVEWEEIHARCEAARPGPWKAYLEGREHQSGSSFIMTGEGQERGEDIELSGATPADYDFIAHARQDIPRLLAEIERLRRRLPPGVSGE